MGFLEHRHVHTLYAGILHHRPSLPDTCKGQPKGVNSIAGMITFTICSIDSAVSIMALWSASKYSYIQCKQCKTETLLWSSLIPRLWLPSYYNQNCWLGRPGNEAALGSSNKKFPFIITADFVPIIYRRQQETRLNPCELQTCMTCILYPGNKTGEALVSHAIFYIYTNHFLLSQYSYINTALYTQCVHSWVGPGKHPCMV